MKTEEKEAIRAESNLRRAVGGVGAGSWLSVAPLWVKHSNQSHAPASSSLPMQRSKNESLTQLLSAVNQLRTCDKSAKKEFEAVLETCD